MRQDGGPRGALDAKVKNKDENGIQHDVCDSAKQYRQHADFPESLGVDKTVHAKADHHEGAAKEINGDIGVGIGDGCVGCSEQVKHWTFKYQSENSQYQAAKKHHNKGIA